jgi:hypothetical protein
MLNKITLKKFKKSPVPGAGWLEKTAEDRLLDGEAAKFVGGRTAFHRQPTRWDPQWPVGTTKVIPADSVTTGKAPYKPQ